MEIYNEKNKTSELIKSVAIDNLIATRNFILNKYFNAFELIHDVHDIIKNNSMYPPTINIGYESMYKLDESKKAIKKYIDKEFWNHLFDKSGVKDFMDSEAKRKLIEPLYGNGNIPDFIHENIISTFLDIYSKRNDMFERGVINLFKGLSWNYKTNQPFKFGKKIIINDALSDSPWSYWSIKSYALDKLEDFQRAFCILDKKPVPDQKNSMSEKLERFSDDQWKGEYFDLKFYKKGTIHLTFNRYNLVDGMNKILSKYYPNALANEKR